MLFSSISSSTETGNREQGTGLFDGDQNRLCMTYLNCFTEQQQDTIRNYIYNKSNFKLVTVFAQSDGLRLGEGGDFYYKC